MLTQLLRDALAGRVDQQTQERLQQGQFATPHVSAWIKDLDRRYLYITPAWEQTTGIRADIALGRRDEDFRPGGLADFFREQDLRILASGQPETREDRFEAPFGPRSFTTSKFPLYDSQGRMFGLGGITTETTDYRAYRHTAVERDAMVATVIESMPEQVVRFTADGRITFANPSFILSFADPGTDVVGRTLGDIFPTLLTRQVAVTVATLTPEEPKAQFDRRVETTDGRSSWHQWRFAASFGADDSIVEVQAVCHDITSERRYQEALERLVATVSDLDSGRSTVIAGVLAIGLDYFDLDVGVVFGPGGTAAERPALHARPDTLLAAAEPEAVLAALEPLPVEGTDPVAVEAMVPTGAGRLAVGRYIGQRLLVGGVDHGRVVFAGSSIRERPFDLSERMLMRTLAQWISFALERHGQMMALSSSRAELSMIIEAVPAYIAYKDEHGRVLTANATARALAQPAESVAVDAETVAAGRPRFGLLERWDEADGAPRWMKADRIPFVDSTTAAPRILLVATDVTELIEKEQALRQANEGLNQFAYIASHDLQEPLRKIGTFTDLLVAGVSSQQWDDVDYAVKVIKDSSRRASALISDLLSWSRLTNRALERKPLRFADLVREVVSDVLAARPSVPVDVVDGMEPLVIGADAVHVRQLIENLVVNAVKYRHPDRRLRIMLRLDRSGAGGNPVFEIEDNGIGFDQAYASLIFEPFRRLHAERQYAGTGVGLAICARVCDRHGWSIRATGRPGEGAIFHVEMNARAGRAALAAAEARPTERPTP